MIRKNKIGNEYCEIIREGVGTSNVTTTTGDFFQNIENGFLVDHYYKNQNVKKNIENQII